MIPKPSEVIHSASDSATSWYEAASEAGEIPFWIVFVVAIYTPFEEFIIKWLGPLASIVRFIPEFLLYGLMAQILTNRFKNGTLKRTPIDVLLLFFAIATIVSMFINNSSIKSSVLTMRSLWRYLSVFYIVANIDISVSQLRLMIKGITVVGFMQAALASLQIFLPNSLVRIFAPKGVSIGGYARVSNAAAGTVKVGAVFGTFAAPAALSAFLLILLIISTTYLFTAPGILIPIRQELLGVGATALGIFGTKKRAAWIIAFLTPVIVLFLCRKSKGLAKAIWVYLALGLGVVVLSSFIGGDVDTSFAGVEARKEAIDPASYVLQLFDPNYWDESSEASRGWVIGTVVSTLIKSGSWFGFGPDLYNTRRIMADVLLDGSDRLKIINMGPVEDTYWAIMLAYFGIVGMGIYFAMLWRLFSAGRWLSKRSPNPEYRRLGVIFCALVLLTLAYNFIERILQVRGFSLYFWLFAGLVVNAYNAHQSPSTSQSQVLAQPPP